MTPELERLLGAMSVGRSEGGMVLVAYADFVRSCGLDHFVLGMATGDPDGDQTVEIRTSLPDAWMEEYAALDHVSHDYVVHQMADLTPDRPLLATAWGQATADQPEVSARTGQVLRGVADAGLGDALSFMGQGAAGGEQNWFAATFGCRRRGRGGAGTGQRPPQRTADRLLCHVPLSATRPGASSRGDRRGADQPGNRCAGAFRPGTEAGLYRPPDGDIEANRRHAFGQCAPQAEGPDPGRGDRQGCAVRSDLNATWGQGPPEFRCRLAVSFHRSCRVENAGKVAPTRAEGRSGWDIY